jgi:pilus assembly protein Flp/PilA
LAKTVLHLSTAKAKAAKHHSSRSANLQDRPHILMIKQFLQEEEGQTLVEYGLLISLIALVVIGVLTLLGSKIKNTFNKAADSMNTTT